MITTARRWLCRRTRGAVRPVPLEAVPVRPAPRSISPLEGWEGNSLLRISQRDRWFPPAPLVVPLLFFSFDWVIHLKLNEFVSSTFVKYQILRRHLVTFIIRTENEMVKCALLSFLYIYLSCTPSLSIFFHSFSFDRHFLSSLFLSFIMENRQASDFATDNRRQIEELEQASFVNRMAARDTKNNFSDLGSNSVNNANIYSWNIHCDGRNNTLSRITHPLQKQKILRYNLYSLLGRSQERGYGTHGGLTPRRRLFFWSWDIYTRVSPDPFRQQRLIWKWDTLQFHCPDLSPWKRIVLELL